MKNFPELKVWQKIHTLTLKVYRTTRSFLLKYGLVSQAQRSSSIPTSIAEGSGESDQGFRPYLGIAFGSANEPDYQLLLAHDLEYIYRPLSLAYRPLVDVKQMSYRLMQKLTA